MEKDRYSRVFLDEGKIRSLLFEKRMTQTSLAKKMDLSRQYLSTVINRGSCRLDTANKLAQALDVETSEIVERS